MLRKVLIVTGGFMSIIWGIAHLIPTGDVVKGFGNISADNRRIITMEWISEGLTLIFIGMLVQVIAIINKTGNKIFNPVYLIASVMLLAMAVLSLFTGFKIDFLPFKLCPVIFSISGILIMIGAFIK